MTTQTVTPLTELHLSSRSYNALRRRSTINSIEQLEKFSVNDLLFIPEIGIQSAEEIQASIAAYRRVNP